MSDEQIYCYATQHREDIRRFGGIKVLNGDTYLVPFGNYEESFGLDIDERGRKRLGGYVKDLGNSGRGYLFVIPHETFVELPDAD